MIKIAFVDWWDEFDTNNNFITRALDGHVDYLVKNTPDYKDHIDFVFCSVFGNDYLRYKCPRVLFTGENCVPDFNLFDYGIGFEKLSFGDRYIRYPLYVAYYEDACNRLCSDKPLSNSTYLARDFCSMVVSNSNCGNDYRVKLFNELSKYKFVASGGRYLNNINRPEGVDDKIEFIKKYKFNIACENVSHNGYCTEKIVEAFAAKTIPIYWGDPEIEDYFNPKAFVNCNNFDTIEDVVRYIEEIDDNDEMYLDILNQSTIINPRYSIENMRDNFEIWIRKIVSQDSKKAYRRSLCGWSDNNEKRIIKMNMLYNKDLKKTNSILYKMRKYLSRL